MATCSTGSIGILSAPQGGCSSYSLAVCNTQTGPKSLCQLIQTAGLSIPAYVSQSVHGYDNFIVDVPTVSNIANTGGVVNCPKLYGPGPITFTMSDSETWITPGTPITMNYPTGVAQPITISSNPDGSSARSGTVCFLPSTGGQKTVTYQQLAGNTTTTTTTAAPTTKYVDFVCISCTGQNAQIARACSSISVNPALVTGEYYCACYCWLLNNDLDYGIMALFNISCNGCATPLMCCNTISGDYCYGCFSLRHAYGDVLCVTTCARVTSGNLGTANESYVCLYAMKSGGCTNILKGTTRTFQWSITCGAIV
jgi:hypothetical protein